MVIVVTEKHQKHASFDFIYTSDTIIKLRFLRKSFCYESLVDIKVSKH